MLSENPGGWMFSHVVGSPPGWAGWGNPCTQSRGQQPDLEKGYLAAAPYPLPPTLYAQDIGGGDVKLYVLPHRS